MNIKVLYTYVYPVDGNLIYGRNTDQFYILIANRQLANIDDTINRSKISTENNIFIKKYDNLSEYTPEQLLEEQKKVFKIFSTIRNDINGKYDIVQTDSGCIFIASKDNSIYI